MSETIIKIENLGKKYLIKHQHQGNYTALRDVITDKVKSFGKKIVSPWNHEQPSTHSATEEFWALKNVSFEVNQGEVIGIIGRNGAGKSTLLKILSRITEPTTGRICINGRVASLLEVGTGFHPELTGRENVFLNGAILGMGKAEIKRKFDEIVAFAEIEKFLDTPVKRYSSGMYVRLAFAVAAHLDPEILLVDEVLAVGDLSFQKKCLGKMEEVGNQGRTVLFVSHNMAMISNLCHKGIVLESGRLSFQGLIKEAVLKYYQDSSLKRGRASTNFESEVAELLKYELIGPEDSYDITIHNEIVVRMKYKIKRSVNGKCVPNFHLFSADGTCVFVSNAEGVTFMPSGVYYAECKIPSNMLNEGAYFVGLALTTYYDSGTFAVEFFDRNALPFNVIDPMDRCSNRYGYGGSIPGVIRPKLTWKIYGDNQ